MRYSARAFEDVFFERLAFFFRRLLFVPMQFGRGHGILRHQIHPQLQSREGLGQTQAMQALSARIHPPCHRWRRSPLAGTPVKLGQLEDVQLVARNEVFLLFHAPNHVPQLRCVCQIIMTSAGTGQSIPGSGLTT